MLLRAAKWVAGRLMRLIPERVLGRLLPGDYGFDPRAVPPPPSAPDAEIRVLIAPANYAGQAWQWARAIERHLPDVGAVNLAVRTRAPFAYPADYIVPRGVYAASRSWQRSVRRTVLDEFSHVIVESVKQPFGAVLDETAHGQIRELLARGIGVLMLCHGTDIRLPSRHMANFPFSPFRDSLAPTARVLEAAALRNRAVLDRLGLPVLVSTPDLLLDVPYATWLPTVVQLEAWSTDAAALTRGRPVVLHAPSHGSVKGSELIDPVLRRLDAEGLVEYRRIEGVPHRDVPDLVRGADVVIEQARMGLYGVAAIEAMAAGRVVLGNVSDHVRDHVREATGHTVPILQIEPASLESDVRAILGRPEEMIRAAEAGPAFVAAVHDGRYSASVLAPLLAR